MFTKNVLCKKLCDVKKNLNTTTKGEIVFIIGSRQGGRILRLGGAKKNFRGGANQNPYFSGNLGHNPTLWGRGET